MKLSQSLRRYWPEMLLFLVVVLPWLSLVALGSVWLWQGGLVWVWSVAVALLGLLAWPLATSIRRRAKNEARRALADLAEASAGWNAAERDAWSAVLQIADTATPLAFTEFEPLIARVRETVEIVAAAFGFVAMGVNCPRGTNLFEGRGRSASCPAPPARIRTCTFMHTAPTLSV